MVLKLYEKKTSYFLDAAIFVLVIFFLIAMFIPRTLWKEEDSLREKCREKMNNLLILETEFFRLANRYPDNPEEAIALITATIDSAKNDTAFFGEKIVMLDTVPYLVRTRGDFLARIDTNFTLPIDNDLLNCPFTNERIVAEVSNVTDLYISCPIKLELNPFKILLVESEDSLREVYREAITRDNYQVRTATSLDEIPEVQADWMPEMIVLDDRLLSEGGNEIVDGAYEQDPDVLVLLMLLQEPDTTGTRKLPSVTGTVPYTFLLGDLRDRVDEVILLSPRRWVREDYIKKRFLLFTMVDSTHGNIFNGDRSWIVGDE